MCAHFLMLSQRFVILGWAVIWVQDYQILIFHVGYKNTKHTISSVIYNIEENFHKNFYAAIQVDVLMIQFLLCFIFNSIKDFQKLYRDKW